MAEQFVSFDITNKGKEILGQVIGGLQITFKRIAIGDGFDYEIGKFVNKTALVNEILSIDELSMKVTNSHFIELSGKFAEADVQNPFYYRELGVYIVDPEDDTKEILYAYGNRNELAEYITPQIQNYSVLKEIKCITSVGSSANVNILISNSTANKINFTTSQWSFEESTGLYLLQLGAMSNDGVKIFKVTDEGITDSVLVEITKNFKSETVLKSMAAFDGYLVCV